jgi:hypothetical protein
MPLGKTMADNIANFEGATRKTRGPSMVLCIALDFRAGWSLAGSVSGDESILRKSAIFGCWRKKNRYLPHT